jgi:hypothetical protein
MVRQVLFVVALVWLVGCSKSSEAFEPAFSIQSPLKEVEYAIGDTVFLRGIVTDENLKEVFIIIQRDNGNLLYSKKIQYDNLTSAKIDEYWVATLTDSTGVDAEFSAADHFGNTTKKTIHFSVK